MDETMSNPPLWLTNAMEALQLRYPQDRFKVTLRDEANAATERQWRIKCLHCPGKLYVPGPGTTLSNFEVHLENRLHRERVAQAP